MENNDLIVTAEPDGPPVNRMYKDILFRYILADKKVLLRLYNALNETDYTDEGELIINTLKDVIYLGYKNDLSFIIGNTLNLYETQCTINPNMPLRGLRYISMIYNAYIVHNKLNEYGTKLIRLPRPSCVVFYSGAAQFAETELLRLSDAFYDVPGNESEPCLEFTATVININYGNNKELLKQCRELEEYALFNYRLREYLNQGIELREAVRLTIKDCINENILRDILAKHKAEVIDIMLTEYDEKMHYEALREEGREEGREEERQEAIVKMYRKGYTIKEIADIFEMEAEKVEDIILNLELSE